MEEFKDKQVKWTYISVSDEPEVPSSLQACAKPNKKCSCKEYSNVVVSPAPPMIIQHLGDQALTQMLLEGEGDSSSAHSNLTVYSGSWFIYN